MSEIKYAPDMMLALQELNRTKKFLDTDGFRKNILENTVSYGLIKNNADTSFANGRVLRDVDSGGDKTIKIAPLNAIDELGRFLYSPLTINSIVVPNDGSWYWVKIGYAATAIEEGTVSIAVNGTLTGVGTKFTEVLRGLPQFPMVIRLQSSLNIAEYQVLEVIDDTNAILSNPLLTGSSAAEFAAESGLTYKVVGCFTPGIEVLSGDKYPFQYDSITYSLVEETVLNTRPTFVANQEFFLARVKVSGADLLCQDKRNSVWETKGSELAISIDRNESPIVGVESTIWQVPTNPANKTLVNVGWGLRSSNWSIDSSQNILTIASGLGGKYKTVADFTDGDLDNFRVYTGNGKYSHVITSVQAAGAIRLTLEHLDVDNYSSDGGTTLITQMVYIVPNCDTIEFNCTSEPTDLTPSVNQIFSFDVADGVGRMDLEVYKSNSVFYNIKYRYKSLKEFTEWTPIPSDEVNGYLVESNFNDLGVQSGTTRQTYTSDATDGFIELQPCPRAYSATIDAIFNEDLLGVHEIETLSATTTYTLTVGTDKQYQKIVGTQSIGSDTIFTLSTALPCRDGSTFRIHFDCVSLTLGSNVIYIKQGSTILKQITKADIWTMLNTKGGIIFSFIYDADNGVWVMSQNYTLPGTKEVKMVTGDPSDYFDGSGDGEVVGWYGWKVLSAMAGRVPIGVGEYTDASGTYTYADGDTGGLAKVKLTISEIPSHNHSFAAVPFTPVFHGTAHSHKFFFHGRDAGDGGSTFKSMEPDATVNQNLPYDGGVGGSDPVYTAYIANEVAGGTIDAITVSATIGDSGGDNYHENRPAFFAISYAQWQG